MKKPRKTNATRRRWEPLTEIAYKRIKEDITRCRLPPDSIVSEPSLMVRYSLGRAPVRSALIRLANERFVQSLPQRGYKIAPVTVKDVLELFDVGLILLPNAARLAAGCLGPHGPRLIELNRICMTATASEDAKADANREINNLLIACTGNSVLAAFTRQVMDQIERITAIWHDMSGQAIKVRHDHTPLIEALISGDPDAAEQAARKLADTSRRQIVDSILASPHVAGNAMQPAQLKERRMPRARHAAQPRIGQR